MVGHTIRILLTCELLWLELGPLRLWLELLLLRTEGLLCLESRLRLCWLLDCLDFLGLENCLRLELLRLPEELLWLRLSRDIGLGLKLLKGLWGLCCLNLVKRLKLGKTIKALDASKLGHWLLDHLGARKSKDLPLWLRNLTGKLGGRSGA